MHLQSPKVTPSNIKDVFEAIEHDLRSLIVLYLNKQKEISEILGMELFERSAERQLKEQGIEEYQLQNLVLFIDFADLYHVLNTQKKFLPESIIRQLKVVTPLLEKLVPVRNRIAHNRPLYYDDCIKTEKFIETVNDIGGTWNNLNGVLSVIRKELERNNVKNIHNLPLPDYEETGFIGRKKQVSDLKKLCLKSPYPVITVIGDGGVGKSSLTLKAAYDIVESFDCPFDCVVWTTSKTTQLTPQEIKNIENAISSSLKMFEDVAEYLAPKGIKDPLEEILDYLSTFKILLILDNLETILDDHIRHFLGNLPEGGSKVLITSRIGVGAYEVPFKLQTLDESDAVQLLRSLADIRQISQLAQMPASQLGNFCKKMKYSPLFIKWFVSAVQTGKRPEEILDKRDLFLEFCMSNVYGYLSDSSHQVLSSMLCMPGRHSQAELVFLNDMDALEFESVIRQLRTTTMFTIFSNVSESSLESKYELSDLARDYLSKHHPVSPQVEPKFKKRQRQLTAAIEAMNAEQIDDPYSFYNISRSTQSHVIVAAYLREALLKARSKLFKEADDIVTKAHDLDPGYFEVYRVEANIKAQQGNYSSARTAYETAMELNSNHAPLLYWFAGFLLRYQNDLEEAYDAFKKADRLDPDRLEIQSEIARTCLYLRRFEEAKIIIDKLLKTTHKIKSQMHRKIYDLHLQYYSRKADQLNYQKDKFNAFRELEYLCEAFKECPSELMDERMKINLGKIEGTLRSCVKLMMHQSETEKKRAEKLLDWFENDIVPFKELKLPVDLNDRLSGIVITLFTERKFGFIRAKDSRTFYFHESDTPKSKDWQKLQEGDEVVFWDSGVKAGQNPKAIDVMLEN